VRGGSSGTSRPCWWISPMRCCSGRYGLGRSCRPKERSLVTVAALTTSGNTDQLVYHLGLAKQNGASEAELIDAITHLACYADWPRASWTRTSAMLTHSQSAPITVSKGSETSMSTTVSAQPPISVPASMISVA